MKFELLNRARCIGVNPVVAQATFDAINATEEEFPGYTGRITSGKRNDAEQLEDWLKGRDPKTDKIVNIDDVVTYAKTAYESAHGTGNATDTEWLGPDGKIAKASAPVWAGFGRNLKAAGVDWGGDFGKPVDKPHAQLKNWKKHRDWQNEDSSDLLTPLVADESIPETDNSGAMWFAGCALATGLAIAVYRSKK